MTDVVMVESAANEPKDKALWEQVKTAAKGKFSVWPSAYAVGWAVQEYKRRGGTWRESSSEAVPLNLEELAAKSEGLGRWFAERWVDISRTNEDGSHPACGRPTAGMSKDDYAKAYPKCVPASVAARMSQAEKDSAVRRKRQADNATGSGTGQKPAMVSTKAEAEAKAEAELAAGKFQNPKGGLNAAGREHFGVKKGVTSYSSASEADKKRWVRWALRFTKTAQPLKDDKGRPTRYALMFAAWGEPVPSSAAAVRAVHTKALSRAKTLQMGQYATAAAEAAEQAARTVLLRKRYGSRRVDAISSVPPVKPGDTPPLPPLGPKPAPEQLAPASQVLGEPAEPTRTDEQSPRQVEDALIEQNMLSEAAKGPHRFLPAQFADAQGQPRCRLCGNDDAWHARYAPEIPIAAAEQPVAQVREREMVALEHVEPVRAFVTEVNGRTILTARADALVPALVERPSSNKHFMRLVGKYVGANKPNRNGAMWSTADLEFGRPSVPNGPLNWLHEAKHVIGSITRADLVTRNEVADAELAEPYLQVTAEVWKWIWPDEAFVLQQASDAGKLWQSMECISEKVRCAGEGGCDAQVSYAEYMGRAGCAHLTQRSGVRRFEQPTFLGGAVIVPPVRPGWAEADTRVLAQASQLAEKAHEQQAMPAGMSDGDWEQLMAQVLRFAGE